MLRTVATILTLLAAQKVGAQSYAYAIVEEGEWCKAIDETGRTVADSLRPSSELYYAYSIHGEGMFPYVRNHRLGFVNHRNELVITPGAFFPALGEYERSGVWEGDKPSETRFRNGSAVVMTASRKFGIINRHGKLLADTVYDYISAAEPRTGVYAARRHDTLCILDPSGRNLLPPVYRTDPKLYPYPKFREGLLCAMVRISSEPYPQMPTSDVGWPHVYQHRQGMAAAHSYKVGFIDPAGKLVIDTLYALLPHMLGDSESDYQRFRMNGGGCGTGAAMRSQRPPDPDPLYLADAWYIFRGGRCMVSKGGARYVINTRGDSLYALQHGERYENRDGYFISQTLSFGNYVPSYSIINRQGRNISLQKSGDGILLSFTKVEAVGHGFFLVQGADGDRQRSYYFIDSNGRAASGRRFAIAYAWPHATEPVVEIQYANEGENSLSRAQMDRRGRIKFLEWDEGKFDGQGRMVLPPSAGLSAFRQGKNGLWGYLNSRDQVVIEPRFSAATAFVQGACAEWLSFWEHFLPSPSADELLSSARAAAPWVPVR